MHYRGKYKKCKIPPIFHSLDIFPGYFLGDQCLSHIKNSRLYGAGL